MSGHHPFVFGVNFPQFGRNVKPGGVGQDPGPPLIVSIVTSSPLEMVRTGFNRASKKPQ